MNYNLSIGKDYKTKEYFSTYTKNGKEIIQKGTMVKLISFSFDGNLVIQFPYKGETLFEIVPMSFLSEGEDDLLRAIVTLKDDIVLNTQDEPTLFKKGSNFVIDSVFCLNDKEYAFISYLNAELNKTSVVGIVPFDKIESFDKKAFSSISF